MQELLIENQLFGVALTVAVFIISRELYRRRPIFCFNSMLLPPVVIIILLVLFRISYEDYNLGGQLVTFWLGPATVALGVSLYRKLPVVRRHWLPIAVGITVGSFTGVTSAVLSAKFLGASQLTQLSLAAKSTTTPIALAITRELGGLPELVVFVVVVTGILGGVFGPELLRLVRIKNKVAIGIGIGTAAHAGGTARALQLGETEGSLSGAAIILTGALTALIAPFLVQLLL